MIRSAFFWRLIPPGRAFLLPALFLLIFVARGQAQFRYQNKPALQVIDHIEQQTPYRFLYRDALLSDISLSFSADREQLFNKFQTALRFHKLDLKVDSSRHQVIIYRSKSRAPFQKEITVRGQVVDAATGERLPFANITWRQDTRTLGVSSNESGSFRFSRPFTQNTIVLRGSYIGYTSQEIVVNLTNTEDIAELTFRLKPKRIDAHEVIVTGTHSYGNISQQTAGLVDIGTFGPLGATNSLRALQALPSVSASPALSDGLNVRGSPADGFQVLLDEVPIYNQTHLFGLLDSFNGDILQRSSLLYDIAPAQFQAPPGGTLSLDTQTGSLKKFSGTAGISNTSARLTLSGPIRWGSSSWLISGRKSFINTVNWLNSAKLVAWGLNVDRKKGVLDEDFSNFEAQLVQPRQTDASFYDLHAALYREGDAGGRLIVSGYLGGDQTQQKGDRLFESFSMADGQEVDQRAVSTSNDWSNGTASIQYHQWLSEDLYSKSTAGGSFYQTKFTKDDFSYTQLNASTNTLQNFIYPFENESVLNEFKADQMIQYYSGPWITTGGLSYHYFSGEYYEDSFDHPGYLNSQQAHQLDTYAQLEYTGLNILDLFGGARMHYYTNGQYLRWSPRIKVKLFPDAKLSASVGVSRNHQFLNKVNLSNTVTADVWVLADSTQQPTAANYFTGGLYLNLSDYFYAQAEGYYKDFEHLRLHELNTYSLAGSFGSNPWLTDNSGTAKGLEFMVRNEFSVVNISQTFTLSEVLLSNPAINDGNSFHADWDRRYQYNATLEVHPFEPLTIYLSWLYATGTPNKLAVFGSQNDERLGAYRRADLSVEYRQPLGGATLNLTATAFNLLDRQNPWYRELTYVIDQSNSPNRFQSTPVDVYDLGFRPSFNLSVTF